MTEADKILHLVTTYYPIGLMALGLFIFFSSRCKEAVNVARSLGTMLFLVGLVTFYF